MTLIECVPNFSEGRNKRTIDAIADAIVSVDGVRLLDVDPGKSTNRTVFTFVGEPDAIVESAFAAIARGQSLIDMRKHSGAHARIGACDVCPFIPVAGASMQDCIDLAKALAERVGRELRIPVYLYAEAAQRADRYNLADVRRGEYEMLAERLKDPEFKPDFGPAEFNAQSGATIIGARPFLIAYNVNLNTQSQKLANEIAFSIREAGRAQRGEDGKLVKDADGNTVKIPGTLKACKAVGWYIDEYKQAQVSINLVDYKTTSVHVAFDEACRQAYRLGLRVTGSEIVGMVPLEPILQAGNHYLKRQGRSQGVSEAELVQCAVQSLGLSDLSNFNPQEKIIEYKVAAKDKQLVDLSLKDFANLVASEAPAPGGGSVAAYLGALSAGLSAMVANLTFEKKGFEAHRQKMNDLAVEAQALKAELLSLVDADTQAFNLIIEARRMAKDTAADKELRESAILAANKQATLVPLSVLGKALNCAKLAKEVAESGNPNSISDAGVAASAALACGEGAYLNVLINLSGIEEKEFVSEAREIASGFIGNLRDVAEKIREFILSQLNGANNSCQSAGPN